MAEGKGHYVVDGYVFETESQARQAEKEKKGVRYTREKLDMGNPEAVLSVYNRILKEKMFVTPVGYAFLRELQEYLLASPAIRNADIHPLDMEPVVRQARTEKEEIKYRGRFINSLIVNVALGLVVIAMMLIMHFSDIPTIVNYENKLIDRYETWEKELNQREQRITEYEEKYHISDGY